MNNSSDNWHNFTAFVHPDDLQGWIYNVMNTFGIHTDTLLKDSYLPFALFIGQKALNMFGIKRSVEEIRGYPFKHGETTCIATHAPHRVLADDEARFCFYRDIEKFKRFANHEEEIVHDEQIHIANQSNFIELKAKLLSRKPPYSCDIETVANATKITCIGFATSSTEAFVFPLWFIPERERSRFFEDLLKRPLLGQNCFAFDKPVIRNVLGIEANFVDDLMLLAWQDEAELSKSLAFLGSIHTHREYHKDLLKKARSGYGDSNTEYYYNGLDCLRTMEIYDKLVSKLMPRCDDAHSVNVEFVWKIEQSTITINEKAAKSLIKELEQIKMQLVELSKCIIGREVNFNSPSQVLELTGGRRSKTMIDRLYSKSFTDDACAIGYEIKALDNRIKQIKALIKAKEYKLSNNVVGGPNGEITTKAEFTQEGKLPSFGSLDEEDFVIFNEKLESKELLFNNVNTLYDEQFLLKFLTDKYVENSYGQRRYFHGRTEQKKSQEEALEYKTKSEGWIELKNFFIDNANKIQFIGINNNKAFFIKK